MPKKQSTATPKRCQYDAGQILRGRAEGKAFLAGYDVPSPATPAIDTQYQFTGWQADLIVWWIYSSATPLYIWGSTGCGKTSGLKQLAARVNYPVYEVTGYESILPMDMAGTQTLTAEKGVTEMVWLLGPLTRAMREGALFIFNEIDMASPSALVALNTVLDGSPLVLEQTGEIIRPAEGFMFAATANSNGAGDDSGAYTGVMRLNYAFLDRFLCIEADYPPRAVEASLLQQAAPTLPEEIREQMLEFATLTRKADASDTVIPLLPMSTRALMLWGVQAVIQAPSAQYGVNVMEKSLRLAFASKRSRGEKAAYLEILQRITGRG